MTEGEQSVSGIWHVRPETLFWVHETQKLLREINRRLDQRPKHLNIPPEDYARHWEFEGPSTAPGSPTDALYRRGLGW